METTYRVGDGVEIRLLDGRSVVAPALTVREARETLRTLVGITEDPASHAARHVAFVREFPKRVGLIKEPLTALGFRYATSDGSEVEFGDLTLADALSVVELLGAAMGDPGEESAKAQIRLLDELPATFGLDPKTRAAEVFAFARGLTEEIYRMIYGIAAGFCEALTASPAVTAITLRAPETVARPTRLPGWNPRSSTRRSNTRLRSAIASIRRWTGR